VKHGRITIAKVMAVVAIVALNVTVARALWDHNPESLIGVAISGLAVEAACLSLVARSRRHRAFWLGFCLLGALAAGSFVSGQSLPPELIAVREVGGQVRYLNVSAISSVWMTYGAFVSVQLESVFVKLGLSTDLSPVAVVSIRAVVWSFPQLFLAMVGGACGWLISKISRNSSRISRGSIRIAADSFASGS
jgi:hypothetical protein